MVDWVRVGTDIAVGGGLGAVDQVIQNMDAKRELEAGVKLPIMKQYGTYYNYGIPILAILGTAFGFFRGDWATRLVTLGSALAGRKATYQLTAGKAPVAWTRNTALEAARQRALAAARGGAKAQVGGEISPVGIPVITDETILV